MSATTFLMLRVSDLKQWAYCPRIVFFSYVMPVDKQSTFKMRHGNDAEQAIDRLEKRRKLTEFGLTDGKRQFHFWCSSEQLGLSGKLDLLVDSPEALYPVDFKYSEQQVYPNHIVQLSAYALILEECFGRLVDRGFIFLIPKEEIVLVEISPERKASARALLQTIRNTVRTEMMPEPTEVRARCDECEFRNYCGDIF